MSMPQKLGSKDKSEPLNFVMNVKLSFFRKLVLSHTLQVQLGKGNGTAGRRHEGRWSFLPTAQSMKEQMGTQLKSTSYCRRMSMTRCMYQESQPSASLPSIQSEKWSCKPWCTRGQRLLWLCRDANRLHWYDQSAKYANRQQIYNQGSAWPQPRQELRQRWSRDVYGPGYTEVTQPLWTWWPGHSLRKFRRKM